MYRHRLMFFMSPLLLALSCSKPAPQLPDLVQEFVYTTLSFSPVTATAAGYHQHKSSTLDEMLDNYGERSIKEQRQWYEEFKQRLQQIDPKTLDPQAQADYKIIADQVELAFIEFDSIQNYKHNPTLYVELVGNALFNPLVLEYAPLEDRYRHIIERMRRVPQLLGEARQNLVSAPVIWTEVALQENEANRDLIIGTLSKECPGIHRVIFEHASREALRAIEDFRLFLRNDLKQKDYDWRLGSAKYAAKFKSSLGLELTPQQVLADAEAELNRTRIAMATIAARSFPKISVKDALAKIATRHPKRKDYFKTAEAGLEEIRRFVRSRNIVPLPKRDNLKVIPTPAFMRGIYAVGGFNPAPALEPNLGAFYWLTPIPEAWDQARAESKLREYNSYGLKILTIHEAIPGHYLQSEYANDVTPDARRALRALYFNGPYVEGWAVYATDVMVEQGYLDNDPAFHLTWLKQYLRAVANTILDIRLHTLNMTDDEAMELMLNQTFQEKEEATAKLQRAKLSSVQLPTYFTGYRAWKRLKSKMQGRGYFNLSEFHQQALKTGAVPMPALERILGVQ
ncbi:MAG: DUF885 domain-containing protein [Bryobacterales bacterium]|nr:DUF885 domain-containing protein [Bryobacterales bacterium]